MTASPARSRAVRSWRSAYPDAVARWAKGSDDVERLVIDRHLEFVPVDDRTVEALLNQAARHVRSARLAASDDAEGAFSLAYDAARKALTSLLAHQGLRPTTTGGHLAVIQTIRAQFGGFGGFDAVDRLRRRRNQVEYPDPAQLDPLDAAEVEDAIETASLCIESATKLVQSGRLGVFR